MEDKNIFPTIKKGIESLIEDEEGNIPGNKLAVIGAMVVVLGSLMSVDAFARGSHVSHSSHSSHSSGSGGYSYHSSHESHQSHQSHQSGTGHGNTHSNAVPSHTNMTPHSNAVPHSNSAVHSNSHSSGGFDIRPSAHSAKGLPGKVATTPESGFGVPGAASGIQAPQPTPDTGVIPTIAATQTDVDVENSDTI